MAALRVAHSPDKGRGIFAAHPIPAQTLVETSPVLLFAKDEWETHGRHTILDHYAFKWRNGAMALALGLGSLFNHSETPNLSYSTHPDSDEITYTTTRAIAEGEELCIYYGNNLWFQPAGAAASTSDVQIEDGWGGLSNLETPDFLEGNPDDIIPEDELPFERFKPPPNEESAETIRTAQAWVVDVPDARNIGAMLKWINRMGLDRPELGHLKRVRKTPTTNTFLLSLDPDAPTLPPEIELPDPPRQLSVPTSAALTLTSLALKNALWPTTYAPKRKGEVEDWTRRKARWAMQAMQTVVDEAIKAQAAGELAIAAYIPSEPDSFIAHDTRQSTAHPLRHAVLNAVRKLADHHTVTTTSSEENGQNYLLTDQTLFTTHEPCIMCSMALLHSRVKEVFFLVPMNKTGGCGGSTCLPFLPGVNHRFGICRWKPGSINTSGISIDDVVDA
uniref:Histone-lysine methyltransferase Set7 n=1 Tax=Mycena chlorophos TaxID=658473 RepID=A0ABQ0MBY4_MYCCL|nr:histone-lysine methyltransferase Set7 [Mycena chlorophos]